MSGLQANETASAQSIRNASTQKSAGREESGKAAEPLAASLLKQFREAGWLPAQTLADEQTLAHLRSLDFENAAIVQANSRKALWQADACTMELAASPAVTGVLDILFGDAGYYLWGAQLVDLAPGQSHEWHVDAETAREGFVSLWIGIVGTNKETSLSVIDGSHRQSAPLQAFWPDGDSARANPAANEILLHPELAGVDAPTVAACVDGEGIFFDGRLWQGSFNRTNQPRRALILHYGKHGFPVRHTASDKSYPFAYHPSDNPITLPIKGEPDPVANKTVIRQPDGSIAYPVAKVAARPELVQNGRNPWTILPYFRIESPVMSGFSCHASVLATQFMPHLPHDHFDEEILVPLSGELTIFAGANDAGALRASRASPGDIFYYPSTISHTISNLSESGAPASYVMFKWRNRSGRSQKVDGARIPAHAHSGGRRLSIDLPSTGLDKLHIHSTTLEPGKGFNRHIDRYDTAILVLEGQLSMMDRKLGPGGVFYSRAGEIHDTRNESAARCHYLVFEFHAMAD